MLRQYLGGGSLIDSLVHTVGGQGKSGAKPARSRHCDRVEEVADAACRASATGGAPRPREGAPAQPREPGDLSPASQDDPRGKGGSYAKTDATSYRRRVRAGALPGGSVQRLRVRNLIGIMDLHFRADGAGVRQRQVDREAHMRRRIVERRNPQHVVLSDNDNVGLVQPFELN